MSIFQATSRLQEARVLFEAGEEEQAISLLETILEQEPNNMAARELLGDLYYARHQYQAARRQYRYVFDRQRHEPGVALKLVEVYLCLPKKVRQAYNVLQRTVENNPDHLTALLRYANFCRVLFHQGQDIEALYRRIEELSAGNLEMELECAADHLFTGQLEQAKAACTRALELAREDSRIHYLFYHIYLAEKNPGSSPGQALEAAEAAAKQILALEGPSVEVYHDLAMIYLQSNQESAALEALNQALACAVEEKERISLLCQIAALQMKQERYAEAIETLEQALALDSQDPGSSPGQALAALYSLVVSYQQLTDYTAALEVLESRLLLQVGPEDQPARQLQGVLYLQAEEFEKARAVFAALVKTDPANANYHYYLALAEHGLGHNLAACQAVSRALRCNRHHAGARALHKQLHARSKAAEEEKPKTLQAYFDPLDLGEFLQILDIEAHINKLVAYIEMRYWERAGPPGKEARGLSPHHRADEARHGVQRLEFEPTAPETALGETWGGVAQAVGLAR